MKLILKKLKWFRPTAFFLVLGTVMLSFQNCQDMRALDESLMAQLHSNFAKTTPGVKVRLGDRSFISSVLAQAFLPMGDRLSASQADSKIRNRRNKQAQFYEYISSNYDSSKDDSILSIVRTLVLAKPLEFGENCYRTEKDPSCTGGGLSTLANLKKVANESVTREGYRVQACNTLAADDRAIENFAYNVSSNVNASNKLQPNVGGAYDLFYRGKPLDSSVYDSLSSMVYDVERDQGKKEAWRALALSLCLSSGWQIP